MLGEFEGAGLWGFYVGWVLVVSPTAQRDVAIAQLDWVVGRGSLERRPAV